jgi:hypothetical protein
MPHPTPTLWIQHLNMESSSPNGRVFPGLVDISVPKLNNVMVSYDGNESSSNYTKYDI